MSDDSYCRHCGQRHCEPWCVTQQTPFKVLVADPPWKFSDQLPGKTRGAGRNYKTMTVEEICRFPLPPLDASCALFLWRVASMQQEALDVIRMWGFKLKTEMVWLKKTSTGDRWFGMGRTVRAEHETCLIATRGRPKLLSHSVRSTFTTGVDGFSAQVARHSEKPDVFYQIVEELCEAPRVELFSRRHRAGWTCMGDEL